MSTGRKRQRARKTLEPLLLLSKLAMLNPTSRIISIPKMELVTKNPIMPASTCHVTAIMVGRVKLSASFFALQASMGISIEGLFLPWDAGRIGFRAHSGGRVWYALWFLEDCVLYMYLAMKVLSIVPMSLMLTYITSSMGSTTEHVRILKSKQRCIMITLHLSSTLQS